MKKLLFILLLMPVLLYSQESIYFKIDPSISLDSIKFYTPQTGIYNNIIRLEKTDTIRFTLIANKHQHQYAINKNLLHTLNTISLKAEEGSYTLSTHIHYGPMGTSLAEYSPIIIPFSIYIRTETLVFAGNKYYSDYHYFDIDIAANISFFLFDK